MFVDYKDYTDIFFNLFSTDFVMIKTIQLLTILKVQTLILVEPTKFV